MDKFKLCMVFHAHQPVGNFDKVFEYAVERCYRPVLRILTRYPEFKCGLHYSGPLLSWLEKGDPEFLDEIARAAASGQVEMLSGGFYEPLLAVIPARDALAQVEMATSYTKKRFGQDPRGFWLAERIWEPSLPAKLAPAGMKYTLVDDTHLYYAGLGPERMFGYHMTEREGNPLALFPTHMELRYTVPFQEPVVTLDFLKKSLDEHGPTCATYGDDTEKFGLWPDTYEWVIEKGWLVRFIEEVLKNSAWLKTAGPGQVMDEQPATGQVYLPTASYEEMSIWALPTQASIDLEKSIKELKAEGRYKDMRRFLRGGMWDNFLMKYPESNLMHKRMLYVSRKLEKAGLTGESLDHLYQAQCNCAYWHGLFGGLYLAHLRSAVHEQLIKAESICDGDGNWARAEKLDLDLDGSDEVVLARPEMDLVLHPAYGGSVSVFDLRKNSFNLACALTRRQEAYHAHFSADHNEEQKGDEPKSIHDMVVFKEEGLEDYLIYDWYHRRLFQDHLIPAGENLQGFSRAQYLEWGDFVNQPYELVETAEQPGQASCCLRRNGNIWSQDGPWPVTINKSFRLQEKGLDTLYTIHAQKQPHNGIRFAVELNFSLLSETDPDKHLLLPDGRVFGLQQARQADQVRGLSIVNRTDGYRLDLELDDPASLWCFPIETVSQSESGLERTYQGSSLTLLWELDTGELQRNIGLRLSQNPA